MAGTIEDPPFPTMAIPGDFSTVSARLAVPISERILEGIRVRFKLNLVNFSG